MVVLADRWVDRREAAKRAGVHYNTIRKWHEELNYFGPDEVKREVRGTEGTKWFYDISALDRIIAGRHTSGKLSEGETRERIAALEAENAELRRQLAREAERSRELDEERRQMLERILRLAERE